MRNRYRVTRYNPAWRDAQGAWLKDDWTSYSDVGRCFNGVLFSEADYLAVETAYVQSVEDFLREAGIESLQLQGLENKSGMALAPCFKPLAWLDVAQCLDFSRLALREMAWGKLVAPRRAYLHFGYDYYMYLGLPVQCPRAIAAAQARELFVEPFRSPYLRGYSK